MPTAPPSRCTQPQCAAFATYQGRCEQHRRKAWANRSARSAALPSTQWGRVAREHLTIEPQCRACGSTTALQVDHITEIVDGGERFDHGNLQTLCEPHHKEKTKQARELRKRIRAAADLDAW